MDKQKDEFHTQLQDNVLDCSRNEMIVVMADLNAKVGNDNTKREKVMGTFDVGVMNNNGERLCGFCSVNGFIITGTNVSKQQSEEIRRKYNTEVRNRFEALGDIDDPEEEHDMILATYRNGAKNVLRRSKKLSRPRIGSKTWERIKERKEARLKLDGTISE